MDHFRLLRKHRREWLRLQGKETVYKMDVELDQILTFHRASLANLYAYFIKHFLQQRSDKLRRLYSDKLRHRTIYIHGLTITLIYSFHGIRSSTWKEKTNPGM